MNPVRALINFFREPPAAPPIKDKKQQDRLFKHWRTRMLVGSLIAYGLFYFVRKNIAIALPLLSEELGYTNTELGVLGSLIYVSYAISKALFGLVGDRVDPRKFMAFGLFVSALLNLFFSFSSSLTVFGAIWFLNGIFQAMGAPPCAKVCVRWFSVSERGTKWGIWNISHQAGGGLILILAGIFAEWFGWRGVFFVPAAICFAGVIFIILTLRDRPEQFGLPPIENYRADPEIDTSEASDEDDVPYFKLVVSRVLTNPHLLLLATTSLCLYVVRYGTLDWGTKYLVEVKDRDISEASLLTSLVEFVGIPGMLLAGWISDKVFKARRAPVCVVSFLLLAVSTGVLYMIPPGNPFQDALAMAAIGFFTYGPQMILAGVAAADTCGAKVAAAAVGVTGLFSYIGAIISSIGTGYAVDQWGWGGGFALWIGTAILGALLLIPLWNARGRRK